MVGHYLRLASRGFARHKLYSFINVAGLSVALACAILILLFVRDQLSYDDWLPNTGNLYRLETTWHYPTALGGGGIKSAMCPFPVLTAAGEQIPQIRAVTHVLPEQMTVSIGSRNFQETVTVVDPDFFQVIRLPLVHGSAASVLAQPESVVLSQTVARRYFGSADPVGKVIRVSGVAGDECKPDDNACYAASHALTVTGVLEDLPHNTQLVADLVVPNTSKADQMSAGDKSGDWTAGDGDYGYVELQPGARPAAVLRALNPILDRSIDLRQTGLRVTGSQVERYELTPFRDVHLRSDRYGGMTPGGSRALVDGFTAIAALILLVAGCNFVNLATARAELRAREIALRRLTGAKRRQLVAQFLTEAVLIVLVSLGLALSLVELLLPVYDRFLGEPIHLGYLANWPQLAALLGGAVLVGVLSGLYPALVLSRFRPAVALKSAITACTESGGLRAALVAVQFALSIGLGIAAIVVFRQIEFAQSLDLGFDRYGTVVIPSIIQLPPARREALARILRSGPGIAGTALSNGVPFALWPVPSDPTVSESGKQRFTTQVINITPGFPALYGLRLLAGRLLSDTRSEDVSAAAGIRNVLINAQAAHSLGVTPEEALGKVLRLPPAKARFRVVGVLADALMGGLHSAVLPAMYLVDSAGDTLPSDRYLFLSVKVRRDRLAGALAFIDDTWRSFAPDVAANRYFLTDAFNELFQSDARQGTIFGIFVVIAVFIGCLGLFGLAVFTAERRTKEVGIRKISGARTGDILRLMLWRISVPVLMANLIAWPVTYLYLDRWLSRYAYRLYLSPLYFLAAGALALVIAWATVYASTLRVARASPIRALRYE
jgi:putative ABC transport system permease protein